MWVGQMLPIAFCALKSWMNGSEPGDPASGQRSGEGVAIERMRRADVEVPLVVMTPTDYTEAQIERLALYAGQSCSLVHEILLAGEIVRRIATAASGPYNSVQFADSG